MCDRDSLFQFNKLQNIGQIPAWVCCQFEGNEKLETTLYCAKSDDIASTEEYQLDWEVSPSAGSALVVKGEGSACCALFVG